MIYWDNLLRAKALNRLGGSIPVDQLPALTAVADYGQILLGSIIS